MSISDAHYLFFFFLFFRLIIPYKYYQKCCYACFCERGRPSAREPFFIVVHEFQIIVLEEEDEEEEEERRVFT